MQTIRIPVRFKTSLVRLLQLLPIHERPWYSISVDFIEQLPQSNGFTAVLVVIDHLSKEGIFIPSTSIGVADAFVTHVFSKHGIVFRSRLAIHVRISVPPSSATRQKYQLISGCCLRCADTNRGSAGVAREFPPHQHLSVLLSHSAAPSLYLTIGLRFISRSVISCSTRAGQ